MLEKLYRIGIVFNIIFFAGLWAYLSYQTCNSASELELLGGSCFSVSIWYFGINIVLRFIYLALVFELVLFVHKNSLRHSFAFVPIGVSILLPSLLNGDNSAILKNGFVGIFSQSVFWPDVVLLLALILLYAFKRNKASDLT